MKIVANLFYLGTETKTRKKDNSTYVVAKFLDPDSDYNFNALVPAEFKDTFPAPRTDVSAMLNLRHGVYNGDTFVNFSLLGLKKALPSV